ncbi:MAG: hypothetical protein PF450_15375 [Bacteroidales bacterium]|jgi:nitrogen fixation-related uncharacterized protein|nr:hypothetical protein [Bacteroidales bacterium]
MKKRILFAVSISVALLGVVVIRWAVTRWHHQDLMFERLNILYLYRDSWASKEDDFQILIDEQWDMIEYYLKHPLMLEPKMPGSLNSIKTRPSFWEHMILPIKIKEIQGLRENLSQDLVTDTKSTSRTADESPTTTNNDNNASN